MLLYVHCARVTNLNFTLFLVHIKSMEVPCKDILQKINLFLLYLKKIIKLTNYHMLCHEKDIFHKKKSESFTFEQGCTQETI